MPHGVAWRYLLDYFPAADYYTEVFKRGGISAEGVMSYMNVDASISAMRAADMRLAVSANNVANVFTPDFKASRAITREQAAGGGVDVYTVQTDRGTDLGEEMVDQSITSNYAKANGVVIKTSNEMFGTLLDMFA